MDFILNNVQLCLAPARHRNGNLGVGMPRRGGRIGVTEMEAREATWGQDVSTIDTQTEEGLYGNLMRLYDGLQGREW